MIREIKEMGYVGGMTILKDYMLLVKSAHVQRLVDRFETDPGRQGQMDWGECGSINLPLQMVQIVKACLYHSPENAVINQMVF